MTVGASIALARLLEIPKDSYKEKTKRVLQEMADQGKIGCRGVKAVIDHYDDFMETVGHTGAETAGFLVYV
jgi:hypothetical protein